VTAAFDALGRECAAFIAHDLDHDNTRLLRERRLSAVLHHDLRQDMRGACQIIMRAHKALPDDGPPLPSAIQVVTPFDMPPGASSAVAVD
jgi:LacI family transcriptional regulator